MLPSMGKMKGKWLLRWLVAVVGGTVGCVAGVWVVLWVSLRSSAVRVPEVKGLDLAAAAGRIQESGLVVRVQEGVFDPLVPVGRVATQRPPGGFELKRGASVLLRPSLGKEARRVGDLSRQPVSLAEAELESEGLVVSRRSEVFAQADAVVVLAHTPAAGALVAPGSGVALLINRTPRQATYIMPDFVGVNEADAGRVIRALGFRLAAIQRVAYSGAPPGVVLRQDPSGGGPVTEAAVVGLWVSR